MAVTARWYTTGAQHFLRGEIEWLAAAGTGCKLALHTSSYTPAIDTDEFQSVIAGEHAATGTYVDGGLAMTLVDAAVVQDTAVDAHVVSTAYVVGDLVRPSAANGYIYRCITAGTGSGTAPTWPTTVGKDTTTDNGVFWENVGTSYIKLDASDVQWAASTLSADYAVIYVDGSDGTLDFLIGLIDFGGTESSSAGDFDVVFDANGALQAFISL